jgi:hypothetical protein
MYNFFIKHGILPHIKNYELELEIRIAVKN